MSSKVWKNRNGGFTLVELLVVMGLLGILFTVTTAFIRNSLDKARTAKCTANLLALHKANVMYATEHGYYVPAAEDIFSGGNTKRWHGTRPDSSESFDGTQGPLSPYLGPGRMVRSCPAFHPEGEEGFEKSCGGYGYNDRGVGSQQYRYGFSAKAWAQGMPVDGIEFPESTVMFCDAAFNAMDGKQLDHLIEYSFAEAPYFVSIGSDGRPRESFKAQPSIHFRHDGHANVVWVDGHTSLETMETFYDDSFTEHDLGWFGEDNNELFDPY